MFVIMSGGGAYVKQAEAFELSKISQQSPSVRRDSSLVDIMKVQLSYSREFYYTLRTTSLEVLPRAPFSMAVSFILLQRSRLQRSTRCTMSLLPGQTLHFVLHFSKVAGQG